MATLDQAPEQLRAWIKEVDEDIARLIDRREAFAVALAAVNGEVVEAPKPPIAESKPVRQKVTLTLDERELARRERDAERQRRNRAGIKQPGTSKYDYAEVARIANAAARAGTPLGRSVADHYKVQPTMGSFLIAEARRRGHDIPKLGANKPIKMTATVKPPATNVTPIAGRGFTPDDAVGLLGG